MTRRLRSSKLEGIWSCERRMVVKRFHAVTEDQRPDVPWVREPQQDRGARTKSRLLDVAVEILQEGGVGNLTIANVAKRSNTSFGSIYHYFKNKQSIVHAVVERMSHELSLTAREGLRASRWEGVPLEDILAGYLSWNIAMQRDYGGVIQAQRALAIQDKVIARELARVSNHNEKLMRQLLLPRIENLGHKAPKQAFEITLDILRGSVAQRSRLFPPNRKTPPSRKSDREWTAEIVKMIMAYLSAGS